MHSDRRDKLVETALRLFYERGIHAVGIDTVLEEAGVAKMTLYNHFKSKDDLVMAALKLRDERWREWFVRSVESRSPSARGRLTAVFDALGEWFARADFRGCMFINTAAECVAAGSPARAAAAGHVAFVRDHLRGLAVAAGLPDPGELADRLSLLVEGAVVTAYVGGRSDAAAVARRAAAALLAADGKPKKRRR